MIQTGFVELGMQTGAPWPLNSGSGFREFVSPDVPFASAFAGTPHVQVALSGLQASGGEVSLILQAINVQNEEFNIRIVTDGNAQIQNLTVTWLAHD